MTVQISISTVESMGAFGKEATKLCKFLAKFGDESCYSVGFK
jgi:hypothetical protein